MGEYADMILDGTICQKCSCVIEDSLGEFPQDCVDCKVLTLDDIAQGRHKKKAKPATPPAQPLPKWKGESDDDVTPRYHCNHCPRHFKTDESARDHVRSMHKETP